MILIALQLFSVYLFRILAQWTQSFQRKTLSCLVDFIFKKRPNVSDIARWEISRAGSFWAVFCLWTPLTNLLLVTILRGIPRWNNFEPRSISSKVVQCSSAPLSSVLFSIHTTTGVLHLVLLNFHLRKFAQLFSCRSRFKGRSKIARIRAL